MSEKNNVVGQTATITWCIAYELVIACLCCYCCRYGYAAVVIIYSAANKGGLPFNIDFAWDILLCKKCGSYYLPKIFFWEHIRDKRLMSSLLSHLAFRKYSSIDTISFLISRLALQTSVEQVHTVPRFYFLTQCQYLESRQSGSGKKQN
jgi:hypothetical protein